jgi:hypothetical protein
MKRSAPIALMILVVFISACSPDGRISPVLTATPADYPKERGTRKVLPQYMKVG